MTNQQKLKAARTQLRNKLTDIVYNDIKKLGFDHTLFYKVHSHNPFYTEFAADGLKYSIFARRDFNLDVEGNTKEKDHFYLNLNGKRLEILEKNEEDLSFNQIDIRSFFSGVLDIFLEKIEESSALKYLIEVNKDLAEIETLFS